MCSATTQREALPYAPSVWYLLESVKVGYEISFARHFYNPITIHPLEERGGDILARENETERPRPRSRLQGEHRGIERSGEYIVNERNSRINGVH